MRGSNGIISRNLPLLFIILLLAIIMTMLYDAQEDFTLFVKEPLLKPNVTNPIKNKKPKKPKKEEVKVSDDPSDLQAEDEGVYEDTHEDFNPK